MNKQRTELCDYCDYCGRSTSVYPVEYRGNVMTLESSSKTNNAHAVWCGICNAGYDDEREDDGRFVDGFFC